MIEDKTGNVKIIDFSISKQIIGNNLFTNIGTLHFKAPEYFSAFEAGYDLRIDIWSIGVILYALVHGYLPFDSKT